MISAAEEKRRSFLLQVFKDHPDQIPLAIQEKILLQQVVLGMSPYDAHLAAGAFSFEVGADQTKWGRNSDPRQVMWAQSQQPDDSRIRMIFKNPSQFPDVGLQRFAVTFVKGRATAIDKMESS